MSDLEKSFREAGERIVGRYPLLISNRRNGYQVVEMGGGADIYRKAVGGVHEFASSAEDFARRHVNTVPAHRDVYVCRVEDGRIHWPMWGYSDRHSGERLRDE